MKITTRQSYDVLVVDMEGRLDSKSSGYSSDEMVAIAKGDPKRVVVNLEKLDFITSAGLRVLLMASKLLKSAGGDLKLCSPNTLVKEVLETAGFDSLLHLYETEAEAVKSF
ncbi:MAG TPA: STAS domain-containing protein [Leptolyngbyaceae cyanobacterium M65_K2018_010]|nr:STAS domain-containing protein [Leptolyngbyaceae cyanobacterium M65_K2018_010]